MEGTEEQCWRRANAETSSCMLGTEVGSWGHTAGNEENKGTECQLQGERRQLSIYGGSSRQPFDVFSGVFSLKTCTLLSCIFLIDVCLLSVYSLVPLEMLGPVGNFSSE